MTSSSKGDLTHDLASQGVKSAHSGVEEIGCHFLAGIHDATMRST